MPRYSYTSDDLRRAWTRLRELPVPIWSCQVRNAHSTVLERMERDGSDLWRVLGQLQHEAESAQIGGMLVEYLKVAAFLIDNGLPLGDTLCWAAAQQQEDDEEPTGEQVG